VVKFKIKDLTPSYLMNLESPVEILQLYGFQRTTLP